MTYSTPKLEAFLKEKGAYEKAVKNCEEGPCLTLRIDGHGPGFLNEKYYDIMTENETILRGLEVLKIVAKADKIHIGIRYDCWSNVWSVRVMSKTFASTKLHESITKAIEFLHTACGYAKGTKLAAKNSIIQDWNNHITEM